MPPLKWQSSSASQVTGMNLLFSAVVPEDLANHFTSLGQSRFFSPDITFWNVTQLTQYQDQLIPMTDLGVHEENYADYWKSIGTVNGMWLGLPVKADPKTLIWYSPANFSAGGFSIPTTWADFKALLDNMKNKDNLIVAFSFSICIYLFR